MRYAVVRVIHSPTAGDVRTARLVVEDVPDKTTAAEVAGALEQQGRAVEFSEAGVPFGNHEIRAEGRGGWPKGIAALDQAEVMSWARLMRKPDRNEGKRITLRLEPSEFAAITLAATRAGATLQGWCMSALLAAAGAGAGGVSDDEGAR